MVDDDDEGFGDFKFAQPSPTFQTNSMMMNGHDPSPANDGDDDDWGDFIQPGGLLHAVSLPRFPNNFDPIGLFADQKVKNENSEPIQPGSAPARVISGVDQWKKTTGALPLSIFGELEEEEGSGSEVPSFGDGGANLFSSKNFDSFKKGSSANVNDLIADLYKKSDSKIKSGSDLNRSNSVEEMNENEKNSGLNMSGLSLGDIERNSNSRELNFSWNWENSKAKAKVEPTLDSRGLNLDWDPLNLNPNGSNSNKDVAEVKSNSNVDNLGFDDGNERLDCGDDDEWEFKDAQPKTSEGEQISKTKQIKTENGSASDLNGFNSSWNSLSFDFNGWNANLNSVSSITSFFNTGLVNQNGEHAAAAEEEDEDDGGWEFKVADSNAQIGDSKKDGQIKNELNFNGSGSSWDVLSSDFNGLNPNGVSSDERQFNAKLMNEKDSDAADAWAFKGAELDLKFTYGKSKIRTENGLTLNSSGMNSSLSALSLDGRTSSNLNGLNLDIVQGDLNLFDTNEDFGIDDGWEFKMASAYKLGDGNSKDDGNLQKDLEGAIYTFGFGSGVLDPGDLFGASQRTSQNFGESKSEFCISSNDSRQNNTESQLPFSSIDDKLCSVENSWAFKDVFSEVGPKDKEETKVAEVSSTVEALVLEGDVQENRVEMDNQKKALPLSFFGEENEADYPVTYQDISIQMHSSDPIVVNKKPQVDINDLISSLYSQAVQNTSIKDEQMLKENAFNSTSTGTVFNIESDDHDFDDDSWEYQDASLGALDENVHNQGESLTKYFTETELNDYVEFFSKLREELYYIALQQLENLKAQSASALNDSDAKIQTLDKEIQDLKSELQDNIISGEICAENLSPRKICLNAFVEVLQGPKFQLFASEYQLTKKLSLAENDCRSTIELLKCVVITVNILTLLSREEQSSYISAWSKMLSVCAQELRHGAFIWKQAMKENLHNQILSKPQGKEYLLALGEIYRVAEVLGCSAKLYKPWILASSGDSLCIFTLVSECLSLWSSSGLEEAFQTVLSSADFQYDGSLQTLLESINYIKDLDVHALYNHVFSGQIPTCQLSALTAGLVPGMKTVAWNGKHCFLTLANLWANLVSSDPPNLPRIRVG